MPKIDPYQPLHGNSAPVAFRWEYFMTPSPHQLAHLSICGFDDMASVVCAPVREMETGSWQHADEQHLWPVGPDSRLTSRQPTGRGILRVLGKKWVR